MDGIKCREVEVEVDRHVAEGRGRASSVQSCDPAIVAYRSKVVVVRSCLSTSQLTHHCAVSEERLISSVHRPLFT